MVDPFFALWMLWFWFLKFGWLPPQTPLPEPPPPGWTAPYDPGNPPGLPGGDPDDVGGVPCTDC